MFDYPFLNFRIDTFQHQTQRGCFVDSVRLLQISNWRRLPRKICGDGPWYETTATCVDHFTLRADDEECRNPTDFEQTVKIVFRAERKAKPIAACITLLFVVRLHPFL